jgi:hypothetical protein
MHRLASAKSVAVFHVDAVFIIRYRTGDAIALVEPFQQVTVFAASATKWLIFWRFGLPTERA